MLIQGLLKTTIPSQIFRQTEGADGVDGMSVDEILAFLKDNKKKLVQKSMEEKYKKPVRKVEIQKNKR